MQAPFPWFGGKSRAAGLIWERLGWDVANYVEPFAGSLAVLLGRPGGAGRYETVNDKDAFLANFWRALQGDPAGAARWADWPVNENDLHARHAWLLERMGDFRARLEGDPDFYDVKVAGWWVWGVSSWIGTGFLRGSGPWRVVDGKLVDVRALAAAVDGPGLERKLPHLGDGGKGVNRQLPHFGNAGMGVNRQLPQVAFNRGIHSNDYGGHLLDWFLLLRDRLRRVRVVCGEWDRVLGESVTVKLGVTGVVLDPPYDSDCHTGAYTSQTVGLAARVREWALDHGSDRRYRIALCGYEGSHAMPGDWECVAWKARGGYGVQGEKRGRRNAGRERVWFSPGCLRPELF